MLPDVALNGREENLRDSVVVINKITGDTLRSPELWWDRHPEILFRQASTRPCQGHAHIRRSVLVLARLTSRRRLRNAFNVCNRTILPSSRTIRSHFHC